MINTLWTYATMLLQNTLAIHIHAQVSGNLMKSDDTPLMEVSISFKEAFIMQLRAGCGTAKVINHNIDIGTRNMLWYIQTYLGICWNNVEIECRKAACLSLKSVLHAFKLQLAETTHSTALLKNTLCSTERSRSSYKHNRFPEPMQTHTLPELWAEKCYFSKHASSRRIDENPPPKREHFTTTAAYNTWKLSKTGANARQRTIWLMSGLVVR